MLKKTNDPRNQENKNKFGGSKNREKNRNGQM